MSAPRPPDLPDDPETLTRADLEARIAQSAADGEPLALRDVVVAGEDLANLDLRGARLLRVAIRDARLTGASLLEAALRDVTLESCRADFAVFGGMRAERMVLADCDLVEASFDDAFLGDVRIEHCTLDRATFARLRLKRLALVRCDLVQVRSIGDLRGAALSWPDVLDNAAVLAAAAGFSVLAED